MTWKQKVWILTKEIFDNDNIHTYFRRWYCMQEIYRWFGIALKLIPIIKTHNTSANTNLSFFYHTLSNSYGLTSKLCCLGFFSQLEAEEEAFVTLWVIIIRVKLKSLKMVNLLDCNGMCVHTTIFCLNPIICVSHVTWTKFLVYFFINELVHLLYI